MKEEITEEFKKEALTTVLKYAKNIQNILMYFELEDGTIGDDLAEKLSVEVFYNIEKPIEEYLK